jgi:hypothetical protein
LEPIEDIELDIESMINPLLTIDISTKNLLQVVSENNQAHLPMQVKKKQKQ